MRTITVKGETRFVQNKAAGDGGVFYVSGADTTTLAIKEDTLFQGNVATRKGGAVFISRANKMTIKNALFVDNEANEFGGGAIFAEVDRSSYLPSYR